MSHPTRRTRIVCISDTHNSAVKLPKGDVLIHAGDLTNQGSYSELSKAVQWLEKADFEAKIVIAGNHDITLDRDFYSKHGSSFHNQSPQDAAKCLSLLTSSRSITYLQHGSATIRLTRPDGPGTEFIVFGSPYSPQYGTWAFMYPRSTTERGTELLEPNSTTTLPPPPPSAAAATASPSTARELWAAIPPTTDILITHTPPTGHCDDACGCDELAKALAKVRPRLHVCGHVHQARGAERVRWGCANDEAAAAAAAAAEVVSTEPWQDPSPDPASAKISLVDLTARGGKRPLDWSPDSVPPVSSGGAGCGTSDLDLAGGPTQRVLSGLPLPGPGSQGGVVVAAGSGDHPAGRGENPGAPRGEPGMRPESTTRRLGSVDRAGRRETCVVNCAIVATGWPHTGGKRFNKPIVVDLDLPVWRLPMT